MRRRQAVRRTRLPPGGRERPPVPPPGRPRLRGADGEKPLAAGLRAGRAPGSSPLPPAAEASGARGGARPRSRREAADARPRRPLGQRRGTAGREPRAAAGGGGGGRAAGGRPAAGVPALPARLRRGPAGRTHVALRVDGLQQPVPDLLRGGGRSRCHCLGEAGRLRPGRAGGGARPGRGGGSSLAGGGLLGEPESHDSLPARRGRRRSQRGAGGNRDGATGPGPTVPLRAKLNCGQEPAPRRAPWDTPDAVTHGAPLTPRRTHRRARRAPARWALRGARLRSAAGAVRACAAGRARGSMAGGREGRRAAVRGPARRGGQRLPPPRPAPAPGACRPSAVPPATLRREAAPDGTKPRGERGFK